MTDPEPSRSAADLARYEEQNDVHLTDGSAVIEHLRAGEPMRPPSERMVEMSTGQILQYEPMTGLEIQYAIEEIQAALDRYTTVYPMLLGQQYTAERAFILAEATARLNAPPGGYDADRRAWAKAQSMTELEAWQLAKEKVHSADKLADALKTKMFGLLNLNKALTAQMQSFGGAR